MRNKSKSLIGDIIIAVFIGCILTLAFWFFFIAKTDVHSFSSSGSDEGSYERVGKTLKFDLLDDSIMMLENNLNQLKMNAEVHRTNLISSNGMHGNGLGISTYSDSARKSHQKFLVLTDFGLNQNRYDFQNGSSYYYKDGISYLRTPILNKIRARHFRVNYEDKVVKYRYDTKANKVLIPLSNGTQLILAKIFCYTIVGIMLFIYVFGFLLVLKFLIGISQNKIFEEINIRRLFWIAICCFAIVLLPYCVSFIIYLFYMKTLSDGAIYTKAISSNDFYFF